MKKLCTLSLLALCISAGVFGQEWTVKISGGYGWPGLTNTNAIKGFQPYLSNDPFAVSKVLDPAYASVVDFSNYTGYGNYNGANGSYQDTAGSRSTVRGSYGQGWNLTAEIAYKVNPYFALGIGINYLWGSTTTATQLFGNQLATTLGPNTVVTQTTHASGVSLLPNITIYGAKPEWKLKPYVRAGINLPIAGKVVHDINVNSPSALLSLFALNSNLRVETEATVSVGLNGALGLSYNPIPLIGIFAELSGTYLNVKAKTATLTKYTIEGTPSPNNANPAFSIDRIAGTGQLPDIMKLFGANNDPLTQYSKVIEFVNQVDGNSNSEDYGKQRANTASTRPNNGKAGYVDENKNHQQIQQYAPFSNFGINVGITISLSKKIFQDPTGRKAKQAATK